MAIVITNSVSDCSCRNQEAAQRIERETKALNSDSTIHFIPSGDLTLLRNVDNVCRQIQAKEARVNLLFLTPGYLTLKGRTETAEGLDAKFSVNYYARMRFATNLMPQLNAAADSSPGLSRVVSVLSAGNEGKLIEDDLSLRTHFLLRQCLVHSTTMTALSFETLATKNPRTSFVHSFPGGVRSGQVKNMGSVFALVERLLMPLASLFMTPEGESGERHLYAATADVFAPREGAMEGTTVAVGSDGKKGSGTYLVNARTDRSGNEKALNQARASGQREKVWEHTTEIFKEIIETQSGV